VSKTDLAQGFIEQLSIQLLAVDMDDLPGMRRNPIEALG